MGKFGWLTRSPQSVGDSQLQGGEEDHLSAAAAGSGLPAPAELPVDTSGCTGFKDLPHDLLEHVFRHLGADSKKTRFNVCAVSRSWRELGQQMFFSRPWDSAQMICHPNQLFSLSPRLPSGSRSGLLKCFVRRELPAPGFPDRRFTFHLGKDPQQVHRTRFLMCGHQHGRHATLHLDARCEGAPCAHLSSNFLSTRYQLTLQSGTAVIPDPEAAAAAGAKAAAAATSPEAGSEDADQGGEALDGQSWTDAASEASAHAATGAPAPAPQKLFELHYKARIRGMMQPRRMVVTLPNPAQLASSQALPQMWRAGSAGGSEAPARPPHQPKQQGPPQPQLRRSLSKPSAVAALEAPPPAPATPQTDAGLDPPATSTSAAASPSTAPATAAEGLPPAAGAGGAATAAEEAPHPLGSGRLGRLLLRLGGAASSRSGARCKHKTAPAEEALQPVCLRNKSPRWNNGLKCWCLNFRGRVKLASVKNFQLVRTGEEEERVLMQFGKVGDDLFVLDFNPTALSALQAFAIALSTFDNKVVP